MPGEQPERTPGLSISVPVEMVEAIVAVAAEHVLEELRDHSERDPWPEWMSVETAARYLDVSAERLRKLVARRGIPFVQEGPGCRIFFSCHDLDSWMQRQVINERSTVRDYRDPPAWLHEEPNDAPRNRATSDAS